MENEPQKLIPIGEAAKILQVSVATIRRWEAQGKLSSSRTLGKQRRYHLETIKKIRDAA